MTDFFRSRTKLQLVGDVAVSALGGAKNGTLGTILLSTAGSSIPAVGTLATMAGACALGGAILIIPAMIVHKMLINEPNPKGSFFAQMTTLTVNLCYKSAFAFTAGCTGAAILGLAITPVGLASLTASFTLGLLNVMSRLIMEATRPSEWKNDNYLAVQIVI